MTRLKQKMLKWPDLYNKIFFLKHCIDKNGKLKVSEMKIKFDISGKVLHSIKLFHEGN